jgi:hypothetical protein
MADVLDAHVHLGRRHLPLREAEEMFDSAGVQGAVVFADPESPDLAGDGVYVRDARSTRHRLIPYRYIGGNPYGRGLRSPPLPDPASLDGFSGIKWHCHFTPGHDAGGGPLGMSEDEAAAAVSSPPVAALMERAAREGLPVCLEEHLHLTVLFVARYPAVRFVIPHMGMLNGGTRVVVGALAGRDNVWYDTSLAVPDAAAIRRLGVERILFGSDHPYGHPASTLARLRSLGLTSSEEEAILGGNLLALLPPRQGKD